MATRKSRAAGAAIKAYLAKNGLSQQQFAAKLGVSQGTVSQWITGRTAVSRKSAKTIENVTGIPRLALLYPEERAA